MSEPVVVATDQSGVYVRVAKGVVIYLNDGGIDAHIPPVPPMDWSSAQVVCNAIERMRREIYNVDDIQLDLKFFHCLSLNPMPPLEPSCCGEPVIKVSSDYVHKDPRVAKRDIGD